MDISAGLIAKGALGAGALAAAGGTGYKFREEIGAYVKSKFFASSGANNDQTQGTSRNKFDQALLDFLEEGGGIQFKVTKDNADYNDTDLTISSDTTFEVKIKLTKEATNDTGTLTNTSASNKPKGKKEALQKINDSGDDGKIWEWECKIKLKKTGSAGTDLEDTEKNGIKNFLQKIKSSGTDDKGLKKKFIEKCSEARKNEINVKLKTLANLDSLTTDFSGITVEDSTHENNKIKTIKVFTMIDGDNSKLKIKEEEKDLFKGFFSIS